MSTPRSSHRQIRSSSADTQRRLPGLPEGPPKGSRIGLAFSMIVLIVAPGALVLADASLTAYPPDLAGGTLFAAVVALQQESTVDPEEIFRRQCVPCHGAEGKGDGPAANALKPRPSNLTDPDLTGTLTDEAILEVLTNGRGSMPSFGALLEPEELRALVGYIRELSGTQSEP